MSVVTSTITSDGQSMDSGWQLLSIDIVRETGRIPYAQLKLIDGSPALRQFVISDSGFFDPGKKVEIKLRYEDDSTSEKTVFVGLVVAQSVEAQRDRFVLSVEMKDEAVKMTRIPQSAVFSKQSDDELIKKIIQNNGIKAGSIAQTKPSHDEIIQYACTDWDFVAMRADANGLLLCVTDGSVSLNKIENTAGPKKTFEFGIDEIFAFEFSANGEGQYADVSASTWDVKNQTLAQASGKEVSLAPGDLKAKTLAGLLSSGSLNQVNPAPILTEELQAWADATISRSRLALVRGRISVVGFADLNFLDVIEIKGVGKHFNGKALVTGWRHRVTQHGWTTDIRLGLSADWFCDRKDIAAKPAAGLLPPVTGVQIGVVTDYEDDPNKEFRVRVKIPVLGDKQSPVWARLLSPDAGKGRGFFFRPEPGDEVVLGFFNQDPRLPVVLGAMFGSKNSPPEGFEKLSDKNCLKGMVTKNGTKITFDDQGSNKASVCIETAAKNKILLDDNEKAISLADQHGNSITLDKNGISIKSAKAFKLEASDKVEISGSAVDVK